MHLAKPTEVYDTKSEPEYTTMDFNVSKLVQLQQMYQTNTK